jgi:hypothetical protein
MKRTLAFRNSVLLGSRRGTEEKAGGATVHEMKSGALPGTYKVVTFSMTIYGLGPNLKTSTPVARCYYIFF